MSRIDRIVIDRIMDAVRIEEVVGDFVELRKKGIRYLGLCPFHDDRHLGSFVVYPKGNCYKCFKCGAAGGAVDFLLRHEHMSYPDAIRWLGKKYSIDVDMTDFNYTPPTPRPKPAPLPTLTLPMDMVLKREHTENDNLVRWIRTGIKWDSVQRARIDKVLAAYHVGHSRNGHTIFWQIDEQHHVRTGKMMKYRTDGHRDKDSRWNFDFIHATLSRRYNEHGLLVDEGPWPFPHLYNPDKQEMRMTYFGMHLLNAYKRKDLQQTVCIVESEKTALLMAIAYGNHPLNVWMACGGMMNLTRERLKPIIDDRRRIVLYPDRDGISRWQQAAERLHYDNLVVETTPVTKWWTPKDGEKADIADVVVRMINESDWTPTTIDDVRRDMPGANELIDNFNLDITDEE